MPSNSSLRQLQQDVELRSDEVQEIISYQPNWIVRKGNTVFLLVLLGLFGLAWLVKYPDIVKGSSRLVALNAPKLIAARTEGKLIKLLVRNDQVVRKGQTLGVMESTASYDEVLVLQQWIEQTIVNVTSNKFNSLVVNPLPDLTRLGELQGNYASLLIHEEQVKKIAAGGYFDKRQASIQNDLANLSKLKNNTYEQQQLVTQDQRLQEKEYKAYESLEKDKVIAPLELNEYKSKLLAKEQQVKQINAQLTNAEMASLNKHKEILELQKERQELIQAFHAALLQEKGEVEKWLQQYVLAASEEGKVLFVSSLQENQLIANGQALFHIQPVQTHFSAEVMVGQKGLGKIKVGQQVNLKVESYPVEEYGYLKGRITHIAVMPTRTDSFLVNVSLPSGLQTNYGKELFFRNNLSAQADVVTEDVSLFNRLIKPLRQAIDR